VGEEEDRQRSAPPPRLVTRAVVHTRFQAYCGRCEAPRRPQAAVDSVVASAPFAHRRRGPPAGADRDEAPRLPDGRQAGGPLPEGSPVHDDLGSGSFVELTPDGLVEISALSSRQALVDRDPGQGIRADRGREAPRNQELRTPGSPSRVRGWAGHGEAVRWLSRLALRREQVRRLAEEPLVPLERRVVLGDTDAGEGVRCARASHRARGRTPRGPAARRLPGSGCRPRAAAPGRRCRATPR
jgi:hypothetical protein